MSKPKAVMHWSGGKDSAIALHKILENKTLEVCYLVTNFSSKYQRVSMHGVRLSLIQAQAKSIGLPLYEIHLPEMPDMETYEQEMKKHYTAWRQEGVTHVVYGDIFLEDLRAYREKQLAEAGLTAVFPLWKSDTHALLNEFWQAGFETMVVCSNQKLADFAGKILDQKLVNTLPADVDPCGENGEFHTFVFKGPILNTSISIKTGKTVYRTYPIPNTDGVAGFFYTDIFLADDQKL